MENRPTLIENRPHEKEINKPTTDQQLNENRPLENKINKPTTDQKLIEYRPLENKINKPTNIYYIGTQTNN